MSIIVAAGVWIGVPTRVGVVIFMFSTVSGVVIGVMTVSVGVVNTSGGTMRIALHGLPNRR